MNLTDFPIWEISPKKSSHAIIGSMCARHSILHLAGIFCSVLSPLFNEISKFIDVHVTMFMALVIILSAVCVCIIIFLMAGPLC